MWHVQVGSWLSWRVHSVAERRDWRGRDKAASPHQQRHLTKGPKAIMSAAWPSATSCLSLLASAVFKQLQAAGIDPQPVLQVQLAAQ